MKCYIFISIFLHHIVFFISDMKLYKKKKHQWESLKVEISMIIFYDQFENIKVVG